MIDQQALARRLRENGIIPATEVPPEAAEEEKWEPTTSERERRTVPTLHRAALSGLAGDVVRIAANSTEGDPAGILAAFLVAVGSAIGPNPYHSVGDDEHGTTLYAVLVGESAKDRKGHSRTTVMKLMRAADPDWSKRVVKGLSTGEGLIHAVRDAETRTGKDGAVEVVDDGVADKRLLVIEPEFARVLAVKERHGNTLSPVVRDAWDRGEVLSALTKSPYKASGSHISILGNVTESDLHAHLGGNDIQNGLANRILWLVVRRARVAARLPKMANEDFESLTDRICRVLAFARRTREVEFSPDAWPLWEQAYAGFAARSDGLVESLTARGDPITLRLCVLYALLDESDVIEPVHLAAALAVWTYAQASVMYLFGTMTGNPIADRVLAQLDGGVVLTQTELSNALGTHVSAAAMASAIRLLTSTGRIIEERQRPVGGVGRTATRYRLPAPP